MKTNIDALRDTMEEEMRRDDRIVVLGEDVGVRGGVFRATEGLFEKFGADRVIDSPLSELSIVAVGIGLALKGMRPNAEIQFADFIHPAFNQIVNEAAFTRYRSNGDWSCPLVIRAPYGGGIGGGIYHSQSVEAFFAHVLGSMSSLPLLRPISPGCCAPRCGWRTPSFFWSTKRRTALSKARCPTSHLLCRWARPGWHGAAAT